MIVIRDITVEYVLSCRRNKDSDGKRMQLEQYKGGMARWVQYSVQIMRGQLPGRDV